MGILFKRYIIVQEEVLIFWKLHGRNVKFLGFYAVYFMEVLLNNENYIALILQLIVQKLLFVVFFYTDKEYNSKFKKYKE